MSWLLLLATALALIWYGAPRLSKRYPRTAEVIAVVVCLPFALAMAFWGWVRRCSQ